MDHRAKADRGQIITLTLLVASNQRRGAEVFGERLAAGLAPKGWTVDFVSLTRAGPGPTVSAVPLSTHAPGELGRLDPRVVMALRRRLRSSQSQVLLANGSSCLQYGAAAVRTMPRRPALAYASIGEPFFWIRRPRQKATQRLLLGLVDRVLAVSNATADQLRQLTDPRRVEVAETGVPEAILALGARRRLPQDDRDSGLHILFLGGLSQEKGPATAVEVTRRLATSVPCRLRLVGTGPLLADLAGQIQTSGLEEAVDMTGSVTDVTPHLAWADVVVLTSLTEGLPAAALEAGAAGLPVVAFDVGGMSETVIDGVTGRLIGRGDMVAMVEALADLAHDDSKRARFGAAGHDMVAGRFTLAAAVGRYDDALRRLLDERRLPR